MNEFPSTDALTAEQLAALEQAERLFIEARKQAISILSGVGLSGPDDPFGRPCSGTFDGNIPCPCRNYTGDGEPCRTRVTLDPAFPPFRTCGHSESDHLPT